MRPRQSSFLHIPFFSSYANEAAATAGTSRGCARSSDVLPPPRSLPVAVAQWAQAARREHKPPATQSRHDIHSRTKRLKITTSAFVVLVWPLASSTDALANDWSLEACLRPPRAPIWAAHSDPTPILPVPDLSRTRSACLVKRCGRTRPAPTRDHHFALIQLPVWLPLRTNSNPSRLYLRLSPLANMRCETTTPLKMHHDLH